MKQEIKVGPVFAKNWRTSRRIVVNRGGTRSGKTFSICQALALWLLTGKIRENTVINKGIAAVFRQFRATARATVMRDFIDALELTGRRHEVTENKTEASFTFKGRRVEFRGVDEIQKIHGFACDILYINEADEITFDAFRQLNLRTRHLIFIDLNPKDPYTWVKTQLEDTWRHTFDNVELIVSTYRQNPFLNKAQRREIENLRDTDPDYFRVYGEGEYGEIQEIIYRHAEIVPTFPTNTHPRGYGIDFGFANSPTALVLCGIRNQSELYVHEVIYEAGLTIEELHAAMLAAGVDKRLPIFADSADPRMIAEMRRKGWRVVPVMKKAGSVVEGITLVRQFKMHITASSKNIIRERLKYTWRRSGDVILNEPVKANDHAMDAIRYFVTEATGRKMPGPLRGKVI